MPINILYAQRALYNIINFFCLKIHSLNICLIISPECTHKCFSICNSGNTNINIGYHPATQAPGRTIDKAPEGNGLALVAYNVVDGIQRQSACNDGYILL